VSDKITRDHLEAKFGELQGGLESKVNDRKKTVMMAAVGGGLLLLLIFFVLGRRSGKKKTTLVEIRRV
jgi:hypothetical protein